MSARAIPLRRTQAAAIEADEKKAREADLRTAGGEQLAEMQARALANLQRLGLGVQRWEEKGWTWVEPDNWDDPASWPPLARLVRLFTETVDTVSACQMLIHLPHPGWCAACHPDDACPPGYSTYLCPEHTAKGITKHVATALGLRALDHHHTGEE
jgi:hypothetical protein